MTHLPAALDHAAFRLQGRGQDPDAYLERVEAGGHMEDAIASGAF
jgi:hypothetical protein